MYIEKLFVQLSDALKMYPTVDKDKKTFNLVECWRVLRNEDKWKARMVELAEMEKLAAQEKKRSLPRCLGQGRKRTPPTKKAQKLLVIKPKKGKGQRV